MPYLLFVLNVALMSTAVRACEKNLQKK